MRKICTGRLEPGRRRWLRHRIAPGLRARPDLRRLRATLLEIGGDEALVMPDDMPPAAAERMAAEGRLWTGKPEMVPGKEGRCHRNAICLMEAGVGVAATGYGLSEDGLWRRHSWVVTPQGGLVETTLPRVAYFGLMADSEGPSKHQVGNGNCLPTRR